MRRVGNKENRREFRNRKFKKSGLKKFAALITAASLMLGGTVYAAPGQESVTIGREAEGAEPGEVEFLAADTAEDTAASTGVISIPEIVEDAMPCMVQITNYVTAQTYNFFGQLQDYESVIAGTGIIVAITDDEVLIATNSHLIESETEVGVTFIDGIEGDEASRHRACVKGIDSLLDLAIISVKTSDLTKETLDAINVIRLGSSDDVRVGEQVVAIGNALGYGQSVSTGIISAKNRTMMDENGIYHTMLQTDASINPGNSGGALLNMKGELIGINEAKQVSESIEGVGYAIPISIAEPVLTEIGNRPTREPVASEDAAYLGVSVMTIPGAYLENGYPSGAYVDSVVSGLAADEAGIQAQDIITKVNDVTIHSSDDLVYELAYHKAGEEAELTVQRLVDLDELKFEEKVISVKLGSKPVADETPVTESDGRKHREDDYYGLFGRDKDGKPDQGTGGSDDGIQDLPDLFDDEKDNDRDDRNEEKGHLDIKCMTMPEEYINNGYPAGAYISEVTAGGAADTAGIRSKDIIVEFNGEEVENVDDLLDEIEDTKAGDTVKVVVKRLSNGEFVEKEFDVVLTDSDGRVPSGDSLKEHDTLNLFGDDDDVDATSGATENKKDELHLFDDQDASGRRY